MLADVREEIFNKICNSCMDDVIKILCTMKVINSHKKDNSYTFSGSDGEITAIVFFEEKIIHILYEDICRPYGMIRVKRDLIVDGSPVIRVLLNKCRNYCTENDDWIKDVFNLIEARNQAIFYYEHQNEMLGLKKELGI